MLDGAVPPIQQVRAEIEYRKMTAAQETLRKLTEEFRALYGTTIDAQIPDYCNTACLAKEGISENQPLVGS